MLGAFVLWCPCDNFHPIWICFQNKSWSEPALNVQAESKCFQKALWNVIHAQIPDAFIMLLLYIFSWTFIFWILISFSSPGSTTNTKHRGSLSWGASKRYTICGPSSVVSNSSGSWGKCQKLFNHIQMSREGYICCNWYPGTQCLWFWIQSTTYTYKES